VLRRLRLCERLPDPPREGGAAWTATGKARSATAPIDPDDEIRLREPPVKLRFSGRRHVVTHERFLKIAKVAGGRVVEHDQNWSRLVQPTADSTADALRAIVHVEAVVALGVEPLGADWRGIGPQHLGQPGDCDAFWRQERVSR
jgi:hypothetical protein